MVHSEPYLTFKDEQVFRLSLTVAPMHWFVFESDWFAYGEVVGVGDGVTVGSVVGDGDGFVSGVGDTGVVVGAQAPNAIANPKTVIKVTKERVMIESPVNNCLFQIEANIKRPNYSSLGKRRVLRCPD